MGKKGKIALIAAVAAILLAAASFALFLWAKDPSQKTDLDLSAQAAASVNGFPESLPTGTGKVILAQKGKPELSQEALTYLASSVALYLKENPENKLTVVGFASKDPNDLVADRRNAMARVMAVRGVLVDHGIEEKRLILQPKGFDPKKDPPDVIELYLD